MATSEQVNPVRKYRNFDEMKTYLEDKVYFEIKKGEEKENTPFYASYKIKKCESLTNAIADFVYFINDPRDPDSAIVQYAENIEVDPRIIGTHFDESESAYVAITEKRFYELVDEASRRIKDRDLQVGEKEN